MWQSIFKTLLVVLLVSTTQVLAQTYTLISKNKQTTSSSNQISGYASSKAVDGYDWTRWSSNHSDNQWITIDLGAVNNVDKIVLDWETAHAKIYEIYTSLDGLAWNGPLFVEYDSFGGREEIVQAFGAARFVKIDCITRATQWGFSLWEFEVYTRNGDHVAWLGELNYFPGQVNENEAFFHTTENKSYIYRDGSFNLFSVGETGATGPKGDRGDAGDQGVAGAQGDQGVAGAQGDQGVAGAQGDQGVAGAQGDQGVAGAQGAQGVAGAQGDQGNTGAKGDKGDQGLPGTGGSPVVDGTVNGQVLTWQSNSWVAQSPTIAPERNLGNMQPYTTVNYIIALVGVFPSRNSSNPFIGEIIMFGGTFAPRGWALCDGQLLSIAQNTALFSILGTTYGGDGSTTFGLPDLRSRTAIHAGTGPGLSNRRLGSKGGQETVTIPAH